MRAVLILTILALTGTAQAAPTTCPATLKGKALDGVTVFDGPPAEMASMRPEDGPEIGRRSRQTWNIFEITKLGRQVHVECRYAGGATQIVKPPRVTRTCSQELQRLDNKGHYRTLSFSCR